MCLLRVGAVPRLSSPSGGAPPYQTTIATTSAGCYTGCMHTERHLQQLRELANDICDLRAYMTYIWADTPHDQYNLTYRNQLIVKLHPYFSQKTLARMLMLSRQRVGQIIRSAQD